ncbi:MAG TPA: PSD1 and planctomycete cytochrome C domain-containing protein [Verrucomicrobiales bacterium]|nr:PSD1 and planctomycete cytochrome C domain-containing protein [Verrucomicrobiales bacterium]
MLATHLPAASAPPVSFQREILPLLSDHCFQCHGPDEESREAGLRLDTQQGASSVLARESESSELLRRVMSDDPAEIMPPPEAQRPLDPVETHLLQRWIAEGAPYENHWAFDPPQRPAPPSVSQPGRIRNPVDAFLLSRLEREGLAFSPEAPPETLVRRLSLELRGISPDPAEVEAFLGDRSPIAWERLVERFLSSPRFGERMAWDWLDAARYADSNGYQGDSERTMWPWRDWVVRAFNRNLPFDDFTVQQLAGDLLPDAGFETRLATAFNRNHMINGEGGRIPEENRAEYVMDMTETTGSVWLGLTLNCCRCHNHKFDPLTQEDYYRLFAFFNQTPVDGSGGNPQTPPVLEVPEAGPSVQVMIMADRSEQRPTFVLSKGLYDQPRQSVDPGIPESIAGDYAGPAANRLDLARWIVSPDNPLAGRVAVNRLWQQVFGAGLVRTPEDFGRQGEQPAHPELLDWLACEFVESGWDLKHLLRLFLHSAAYRQSSQLSPGTAGLDPQNRLHSRAPRYRLPFWMLRDQALAASGLLAGPLGGPPVNTYQPPGIWEEATFGNKTYTRDDGEALYRRSLYVFWRRIAGPPMFFDNASRQVCTVRTARTNTPLHALATLNDEAWIEAARSLASLVIRSSPDASERLAQAHQRILARPPDRASRELLLAAADRYRRHFAKQPHEASLLLAAGESPVPSGLDPVELAAWTLVCSTLLNLDEALNRE